MVEVFPDAGSGKFGDYRIVEMNPAFERLTGLRKEHVLGMSSRDVFHSPEPAHLDAFVDVITSREPVRLESRLLAPGRVLSMSVFPFGDMRVAILVVDMTEERRTEQALRASESRFRELFNQMSTGVTVYDPGESGERFIIRDVNRAGEVIDKVKRDEIVGREIREVFPGVVEFGLIDVFKKVWRTGESANISRAHYKDERISGWRENHVYRLPSGEIVSLYRDVTERRLMENKIVAKQKMEAIGQLAGGVANDFSNIIGLMSGYTSAISELVPPNSSAYQHARRLLEAEQYAAKLTKRLLSVARASDEESGKIERVSLARAITDTVSLTRETLEQRGVKCTVKLPDRPSDVMVDDAQLRDALINLILNALKAMSEGGGTIRIDVAEKDVDTPGTRQNPNAKPGPYSILRVRDTGHGIKKNIVDRIFEPLFTTDETGGSLGLGLSTAQSSVNMWGGWIEVRSREGVGASFRVFMPRVAAESHAARDRPTGKTVLAVDDQAEFLDAIRDALEQDGHTVIAAGSVGEALAQLKRLGDEISLSIIDAMLPDDGSRALLREILAADPAANVIMMSGFSHDYVRGYLSRGAWGFLQKPFEADQVVASVRAAIGA